MTSGNVTDEGTSAKSVSVRAVLIRLRRVAFSRLLQKGNRVAGKKLQRRD
jgi:hypothetical protein